MEHSEGRTEAEALSVGVGRILAFLVFLFATLPANAELGADCSASLLGRTAQVSDEGSFFIANTPVDPALNRVRATGTPELVSGIDPDLLVTHVIPGAVRIEDSTMSRGFLVDRRYSVPAPLPDVELLFGLFQSTDLATQRLVRTSPQAPLHGFFERESEGFISGSGAHLRFRNLVVVLIAPCSDPPVDLLMGWMKDLKAGMADREMVAVGGEANFPEVEVRQLYKAEGVHVEKGAGFLVHVPPGEADLLTNGSVRDGRVDGRVLGPGASVVGISRASLSREPVLRVARPTGEIVEVSLSEARRRGARVFPAPKVGRKKSMTEVSKRSILQVVMDPESNLARRAELLYSLVELEDPALVQAFEKILASDQDSVLKQHAFKGIYRALKEDGLEMYRKYAADPAQPEVVRRDAILRLGAYGQPDDLALLRGLDELDTPELEEAAERAIRSVEARQQAEDER